MDAPEEEKFAIVERAAAHFAARYPVNTIDGVRITFPKGWGLLRASNTQADPGAALRGHRPGRARRLPRRGRRLARRTGRARLAREPTRPSADRRDRRSRRPAVRGPLGGGPAGRSLVGGPDLPGRRRLRHRLARPSTHARSRRLPPRRGLVHRTSAGGLSRRRLGAGAPARREPGVPRGAHSGHAARAWPSPPAPCSGSWWAPEGRSGGSRSRSHGRASPTA